jgi:hypothetical protein
VHVVACCQGDDRPVSPSLDALAGRDGATARPSAPAAGAAIVRKR